MLPFPSLVDEEEEPDGSADDEADWYAAIICVCVLDSYNQYISIYPQEARLKCIGKRIIICTYQ